MLPVKYRLRQEADIMRVLRRGRRRDTGIATIYTHAPGEQKTSRAACIVGKKISLSAVIRHKYQRWLREVAATIIQSSQGPIDVVLVAKPSILQCKSLAEIKRELV